MSDTKTPKKSAGRRKFLAGLLTGAGAAAAVGAAARPAATKEPKAESSTPSEPVLYHRTEDTDRYYRTLYR